VKQAKVYSVILIPQLGQYLVTLEEMDGIRLVPIWVGSSEGMAIAAKVEGQTFPRPMTHDLMADIFKKFNITVEKVIVTDLKDSTFFAKTILTRDGQTIEMDARPSDSIALAVRLNAPIFIDDMVFDKCPLIQKPITEEEVKGFKKELENLKPEDFFRET